MKKTYLIPPPSFIPHLVIVTTIEAANLRHPTNINHSLSHRKVGSSVLAQLSVMKVCTILGSRIRTPDLHDHSTN